MDAGRRHSETEGFSKRGMQEWWDAGKEGCRKGKEEFTKRRMQESNDAGKEGCRKGGM